MPAYAWGATGHRTRCMTRERRGGACAPAPFRKREERGHIEGDAAASPRLFRKRFFASFFLKERRPPPGFLLKNRQSVPPCYGHVQTAGLPYSYSVVHTEGQRHGIPPGSTAPLLRIFLPLQTGPFSEKVSARFLRRNGSCSALTPLRCFPMPEC